MAESSCVVLTHLAVPANPRPRVTVFLDRDGVIIENRPDHVRSISDVALLPGAAESIRLLRQHADVVIVTNQSVVGRGMRPLNAIVHVQHFVIGMLASSGAAVRGSVICPHGPADGCACRKPGTGMLLTAAAVWDCRLDASWLVGDALTDVQAGHAVGARTILVRTGRGPAEEGAVRRLYPGTVITDSLATGVRVIIPALGSAGEMADVNGFSQPHSPS